MKARISGMPNNQGNMMKRIQQMQEDMKNVQEEVLSIKMEPDIVDPDEIEMLEDLLIAALNESIKKANDAMEQGIEKAKGGLSIPGLF